MHYYQQNVTPGRSTLAAHTYVTSVAELTTSLRNEERRRNRATASYKTHMRSFLTEARRAAGVKETHLAERAGFEPSIRLPIYSLSKTAP